MVIQGLDRSRGIHHHHQRSTPSGPNLQTACTARVYSLGVYNVYRTFDMFATANKFKTSARCKPRRETGLQCKRLELANSRGDRPFASVKQRWAGCVAFHVCERKSVLQVMSVLQDWRQTSHAVRNRVRRILQLICTNGGRGIVISTRESNSAALQRGCSDV